MFCLKYRWVCNSFSFCWISSFPRKLFSFPDIYTYCEIIFVLFRCFFHHIQPFLCYLTSIKLEIKVEILDYIKTPKFLCELSKLNKSWRAATQSDRLWRELYMRWVLCTWLIWNKQIFTVSILIENIWLCFERDDLVTYLPKNFFFVLNFSKMSLILRWM